MNLDNALTEIFKSHQTGQQKYTYFILAAAGTAIGFAVQKTEGLALSWWLFPVGLAVIAWAGSFYLGCRNLDRVQASMLANYSLLQLRQGTHPQQPEHPQEREAAMAGVQQALATNGKQAQFSAVWQFRLLLWGAAFFIGWRVTEMYRIT